MSSGKNIWIFVAVIFLVPLIAFTAMNWVQSNYQALPVYSTPANQKLLEQLPSYNFLNQDREKFSANDWNDKILVVDFFFTHCPVVCPKLTRSLKEVSIAFENDDDIQLTSITVDPEHDNPAQLNKYVQNFGLNTSNWNLITGDKKDIYRLARNAFSIVATDGDGGADDFIHSDKIVLIDPQKRIRGYYEGTDPGEIKTLIKDIKKLKDEN